MYKFSRILIVALLVFVFTHCNTKEQPSKKVETVAQPAQASGPQIPSIPKEIMIKLYNECDYTDYIFHDLPFSMSQDEPGSIRANLNYISVQPLGQIPDGCKAIGRQFFHINGEIPYEANVYYSDNCKFYVFVDGETPLYANMMSTDGIQFFNSMIDQAMSAQKAAGQ